MILSLIGRSVLMLEPDDFLATYVTTALMFAGARSIRSARTVAETQAIVAADGTFDVAVVGIVAGTADEWALADDLAARGIPIVFTSPAAIDLPERLCRFPHVRKTFAAFQVIEIVVAAIAAPPLASVGT
jgi:hypothetical protein